jgi:hypothetical protein
MNASKNSARANGLKAFATLKKVLIDTGWDPKPTDMEGVLTIDFSQDKIAIENASAEVRVDFERFIFYLNFRDKAQKKVLNETMEFITRSNFDLVVGNFELNLTTGALRYRGSIDFTSVTLTEPLIRDLIKSCMDTIEYFANPLLSVIRGEKVASKAFEELD